MDDTFTAAKVARRPEAGTAVPNSERYDDEGRLAARFKVQIQVI